MKQHNLLTGFALFLALNTFFFAAPVMSQRISDADVATHHIKAQAGDAQAQFLLGVMYEKGRGIAQDPVKAANWYRKAAQQDHIIAQLSLGNLYDKGLGVRQSYAEARTWYTKAAVLGNPEAMYFLGSMYYNGDGLEKDLKTALAWLQRSAEQNYPMANMAVAQVSAELAAQDAGSLALPPTTTSDKAPAAIAPTSETGDQAILPLSGYAVQVSSFKTEDQAHGHWQKLQKKKPGLFADTKAIIHKKEFESGRVFYRLNAALFPKNAEANKYCNTLKNQGVDCLVVKY